MSGASSRRKGNRAEVEVVRVSAHNLHVTRPKTRGTSRFMRVLTYLAG